MTTLRSVAQNPIPELETSTKVNGINRLGFDNGTVFPLCRPGIYNTSIRFFVVKKSIIDHYLQYKKSIIEFNDYNVLQEVFSEEDLVSIFSFNMLLMSGGQLTDDLDFNSIGFFENLDRSNPHWNKFSNVILPAAIEVRKTLSEYSYSSDNKNPLSNELVFEFHKVTSDVRGRVLGNYLIVIDDPTIGALKVRDTALLLISECLKVQYIYSSIEDVAKGGLYQSYLTLLKYKQDGIEYI